MLVECRWEGSLTYVQVARCLGVPPIIPTADAALYDYLTAKNLEAIQVDTSNLAARRNVHRRLRATHDIVAILCFACETGAELCRPFDLLARRIAGLMSKAAIAALKVRSSRRPAFQSLHTSK